MLLLVSLNQQVLLVFSPTWMNPLVFSLAPAYLRLWLLSLGFFTLAFVISR